MKRKKMVPSFKIRMGYLRCGIVDAFRLWHIRAIFYLSITSVICFASAYVLQINNALFLSNVLLSISTGTITGVILFWVSALKTSQRHMLERRAKELVEKIHPVTITYRELRHYIQTPYSYAKNIEILKKCSKEEIFDIIDKLRIVSTIKFEELFPLVHYRKKERMKLYSQKLTIESLLPETAELLELSFHQGDAIGLRKGLYNLRKIIDEFSNLHNELCGIVDKCDQLKFLIDTKFI